MPPLGSAGGSVSDASVPLRSVSCARSIIHRILTVGRRAELLLSGRLNKTGAADAGSSPRFFVGSGLAGPRPGHVGDQRSMKEPAYQRTGGTVPGCPGPPALSCISQPDQTCCGVGAEPGFGRTSAAQVPLRLKWSPLPFRSGAPTRATSVAAQWPIFTAARFPLASAAINEELGGSGGPGVRAALNRNKEATSTDPEPIPTDSAKKGAGGTLL